MIKPNELRLGNLFEYHNQTVRVLSILSREKSDFGYFEDSVGFLRNYTDEDCPTPIPLTEDWLLKLGFENWGLGTQWSNRLENYVRYVLHNVLDGTSNFEVHYIHSTYGGEDHYQYIISCDEDDRINWGEDIEHVHQLQNLYYALTQNELTIK